MINTLSLLSSPILFFLVNLKTKFTCYLLTQMLKINRISKAIEECNNPDVPSYQCQDYQDFLPKLEFVADMYEGRSLWYRPNGYGTGIILDSVKASQYLPSEPDESDQDYVARLSRSYFQRFYRNAIQGFVGYLSAFSLIEDNIHPTFLNSLENIDLKGNNLTAFLRKADIKAMRDKVCFIYVEFPKRPEVNSAYEGRQLNLRPYLVLIDRKNVINWQLGEDNTTLEMVTIREYYHEKVGIYGKTLKVRYRVIYQGSYQLFKIEDGEAIIIDEGTISLPQIPLVPYSVLVEEDDHFLGDPPLYDLAELNLKHFQKCSEKDEVMHKCNIPLLNLNPNTSQTTTGKLNLATNKKDEITEPPKISIGANTCLWNVQAHFVEPSGTAIAATQGDIEKLELAMEKQTLSFISWGNEVQRTATEIMGASAPVQANLASLAKSKESAVQQVCWYWNQYYNDFTPRENMGTIEVDKEILARAIFRSSVNIYATMRKEGELSLISYLTLLKQSQVLPPNFDIEQELKLIEKERELAIAKNLQIQQLMQPSQS